MRIKRSEYFLEVIGWVDDDGNDIEDTDDRFNTSYRLWDHDRGDSVLSSWPIKETGFSCFKLRDLVALGFTTSEFNAIMRHHEGNHWNEWIESEEQLNQVMEEAHTSSLSHGRP